MSINSLKNIFKIEINPNRIYGLDILRALAILFVVIGHGKNLLPQSLAKYHSLIVFDGVSIFFVLSGFLIGGIIIKMLEKKQATKSLLINFWIRRWFRTLPNYFLILITLIILNLIFTADFSIGITKPYFFFVQNLFTSHPWFFPEAWSLSIEEWFYLIVPIMILTLIWLMKISARKAILTVALLILVSTVLFRGYRFEVLDIATRADWDLLFRKQVITRLDSLMFGIIGAYVQFYHLKLWKQYKLHLLILGITIFFISKSLFLFKIIPVHGFYNCVISFSTISIATLLLLPYLSNLKKGSGTIFKVLTTISLISYSMYLIHLSLVQFIIVENFQLESIIKIEILSSILNYGMYWLLTIVGSMLIYKYFEKPATKLRDSRFVNKLLQKIAN